MSTARNGSLCPAHAGRCTAMPSARPLDSETLSDRMWHVYPPAMWIRSGNSHVGLVVSTEPSWFCCCFTARAADDRREPTLARVARAYRAGKNIAGGCIGLEVAWGSVHDRTGNVAPMTSSSMYLRWGTVGREKLQQSGLRFVLVNTRWELLVIDSPRMQAM